MRRHGHHLTPHVRPGMDIGAMREQQLDDLGVFLRNRPHERCLTARASRVHVGALGQQLFDHGRIA